MHVVTRTVLGGSSDIIILVVLVGIPQHDIYFVTFTEDLLVIDQGLVQDRVFPANLSVG